MKTAAKIALYIAAVAALAFAGDIAYAAHYASIMAAATGQAVGWTWTDVGALVGALGAFLAVVSTVLHVIAPKTRTRIDDDLVRKVDAAIEFLRSPEFADLRRFVLGNVAPNVQASRQDSTVVQLRSITDSGLVTSASTRTTRNGDAA
jgi:hypothetical protein